MEHQAVRSPAGAWRLRNCIALAVLMNGLGCATARPTAVRPEEIPALEEQLISDPTNGEAPIHQRLHDTIPRSGQLHLSSRRPMLNLLKEMPGSILAVEPFQLVSFVLFIN